MAVFLRFAAMPAQSGTGSSNPACSSAESTTNRPRPFRFRQELARRLECCLSDGVQLTFLSGLVFQRIVL
jgi:hypothetical protein